MEYKEIEKIELHESKHWWYLGLFELVERIVNNELSDNAKILDAGCGNGSLLKRIQKNKKNVEGFDYSEKAVVFSKDKGISNVYQKDINSWCSNSNKYDCIISLDVLSHKSIKSEKKILNNFYKSLNENGILILNLPAFNFLFRQHDFFVENRKRYNLIEINNLLLELGFKEKVATYRMSFLFLIIIFVKIYEKLIRKKSSDLKTHYNFVNKFFLILTRFENFLILKKVKIPFGSSVFAVFIK